MNQELFEKFAAADSLLPAVVQDASSKDVLMLAWVNKAALQQSIESRRATFWSRSRNQIWVKGETSGNYQQIEEIRFDCDSDSFLFLVTSHGPACHTGEHSCFYREVNL